MFNAFERMKAAVLDVPSSGVSDGRERLLLDDSYERKRAPQAPGHEGIPGGAVCPHPAQ